MNRIQKKIAQALGMLVLTSSAVAGPMLMNSDRAEYEVSIQCKADTRPLNDLIEGNGVIELDTGPCTITMAAGNQKILVRDGETAEIRSGKIGLL